MGPPLIIPSLNLTQNKLATKKRQPNETREILADAFFDPNVSNSKPRSQSTKTSPDKKDFKEFLKGSTRHPRPSSRIKERKEIIQNAPRINDDPVEYYERERRPSAPSRLHLPKPEWELRVTGRANVAPVGALHGAETNAEHPRSALSEEKSKRLRLASGLNITLGPAPALCHAPPPPLDGPLAISKDLVPDSRARSVAKDANPGTSMDWMHTRAKIDFNRPPSVMSIGGNGFGYDYGFPYPEGITGDAFDSSSEGEDNDGRELKYDGDSEDDLDEEEGYDKEDRGKHGRNARKEHRKSNVQAPYIRHRRISELNLDEVKSDISNFGEDIWCISTPPLKTIINLRIEADEDVEQDVLEGLKRFGGYQTDSYSSKPRTEKTLLIPITRTSSLPALRRVRVDSESSSIDLGSALKVDGKRSSMAPVAVARYSQNHEEDKDGDEDEDNEDEDDYKQEEEGIVPEGNGNNEDEVDQHGEIDMELTEDNLGNRIKSNIDLDVARGHFIDLRDDTPWISDSIISPPNGYMELWKGAYDEVDGIKDDEGRDEEWISQSSCESRRDTSLFEHSDFTDEDNASSTSIRSLCTDRQPQSCPPSRSPVPEEGEEGAVQHVQPSANTKRTRSGTIVPASDSLVGINARRTRSGTIVGPLSAVAPQTLSSGQTNRTRSGTIVAVRPLLAPAAVAGRTSSMEPVANAGSRRSRSGSILRLNENNLLSFTNAQRPASDELRNPANDMPNFGTTLNEEDLGVIEGLEAREGDDNVGCYVDSLYLPKLSSSPDPIDFLRFARILEDEEELTPMGFAVPPLDVVGMKDLHWRVASEPPSPPPLPVETRVVEMKENKHRSKTGLLKSKGRELCGKGWKLKSKILFNTKEKKKARFVGGSGNGGDGAREEQKEESLSDDELLLLPGTTTKILA